MDIIYKKLKEFGKVKTNQDLSKYCTMGVGGLARYFIILEDVDLIPGLVGFLRRNDLEYTVLGAGSNVIFSGNQYDGAVIKIADRTVKIKDNVVECAAGANMAEAARISMRAGLTGFEWAIGIPGTMGGAVYGNAGAMDARTQDNVLKVLVFMDGELIEMMNQDCQFGYRDSIFKHQGGVILRVWLLLEHRKDNSKTRQILQYMQKRNDSQPTGMASSGCIFKNVESGRLDLDEKMLKDLSVPQEFIDDGIIPAGRLIDACGLKGKKIGGAQISDKHANFIINHGSANAEDVLALIDLVKKEVYDKYGIELKEEVQIIKN